MKNHPLSIDLDLTTKHGLIAYLDTTVSQEAWDLFLNRLLRNKQENPKILQNEVLSILKNRTLGYHLLRKSMRSGDDRDLKTEIYESKTEFRFWEKRKFLKLIYRLLGIFTPLWLLVSTVFNFPLAASLLFLNILIFITYRKESLKHWNQIRKLKNNLDHLESAWKRLHPGRRKEIFSLAKPIHSLGDSSEFLVSPIPHFFLNAICLWDLWKLDTYGHWLKQWESVWNELRDSWIRTDSLLPLAHFSFLHPEFAFPKWNETGEISANDLGHPLIKESARVTNPLANLQRGDLFIITGSNMSGKTTYLRAIAVSILLAGSGGPIVGSSMNLPEFKIHTLIRSQDSLEDGVSFFYSEVRRLSQIIRESDSDSAVSILFLDEILKGTNSKERQIATREILEALRDKGAIVFLTTHDLQLAEIPNAKLFHFTELEKEGEMIFDYKIREGISKTTNALRILKKEGIPIRGEV